MPSEGPDKPVEPIQYMEELFKSSQFHTYHVRLISMMNNVVNGLMSQGKMDQAFGAMELAKKVIGYPATVRPGDDAIKQKVEANKKRFQSNFIMADGVFIDEE